MASNLNSEFNYRYQVIGSTPWEKIKTLQGFLVGRKRAAVLEECAELKYRAKLEELNHLREVPALPHIILNLRAEILELESHLDDQKHAFELNRKEIKILEKYMAELYMEVEPSRLKHPKRPSPAKLLNAMSNPQTLESLMQIGLVPQGTVLLEQKDIMLQLTNQPTATMEPPKELGTSVPKKKTKKK